MKGQVPMCETAGNNSNEPKINLNFRSHDKDKEAFGDSFHTEMEKMTPAYMGTLASD